MTIILCLDEILEEQGVSVSELAHKVGITRANMSNIKTGNVKAIRFSTLDKICAALDCEPGDIIKREKPEERNGLVGNSDDAFILQDPDDPSPLPPAEHEALPEKSCQAAVLKAPKRTRVEVRAR